MTFRDLPPDEWGKVEPIFKQHGVTVPAETQGLITVAEEDGAIVGFVVLQLQPHLEPIWVDEAHRHTGVWRQLAESALERVSHGVAVFTSAPRPAIEHMAMEMGFETLPWTVLRNVKES